MTNTEVISIRVSKEIAEWLGADNEAREIVESAYMVGHLNMRGFKEACDRKEIDYQMAVDRMTELINED